MRRTAKAWGVCGASMQVRRVQRIGVSLQPEWSRPGCSQGGRRDGVATSNSGKSVEGVVIVDSCIPDVLRDRAQRQTDDVAFTFIDFEVDPAGFAESLTWSQLYQRVQVVAHELLLCGSVGDRVAISAPQSFDYIVGLLGALEAGLTAVPLPLPMLGVHDERVSGVLKDCAPVAVITTSSAVDAVMPSISDVPSSPLVIEVDALDLHTPPPPYQTHRAQAKMAFLQYTSGSTRAPAGVVVTHENLSANLRQIKADYFEDTGGVPPPDTTVVSWLPFYHDMGLMLGIFGPIAYGFHAVLTSPMAFLQKPARWMQLVARNPRPVSPAPNFAYELAVRRTSDEDMAGLDLGHVLSLVTGAERIHASTLRRFADAVRALQSSRHRPAIGVRLGRGDGVRCVGAAWPPAAHRPVLLREAV